MVEELANTGAWYVNGAIFSAWSSSLEVEDFISSAQSFVQIGAEKDDTPSGGGMTDASTSGSGGALISGGGNSMTVGQGAVSSSGAAAPVG